MDLGENSRYRSVPVSASFQRKSKLRKSVNAVLPVVRLMKSMRRLCVDPAAVGVEPGPIEISTGLRKAQENLNPSDQYEYSRHLELTFSNNISGPIYTGLPVGEEGGILDLHLIDSRTQNIINCGPEASAKVEIIVLEKDLTSCGGDKSLLRGDPYVTLKDGRVSVSHISFKHTKNPMRKRELRLGARAVYPYNGSRIMEAVTEPFFVKDRRSMGKRLKPPTLDDQVCKLQAIGKCRRNRLMKKNIKTVGDFLTQYFLNREELLSILGRRMHSKKLDAAVNKAKSKLDLKRYLYHSANSQENQGVVFTDVGELTGIYQEGQFVSLEKLNGTQKAYAMELVKTAFQDGQNLLVLDDYTFKMLCSSTSPNAVCPVLESAALDGYNGCSFEDYCPIDTQQQPVPNANYMPDTSFIDNYDNINQINSSAILLDQDDFIYVTESLWDN